MHCGRALPEGLAAWANNKLGGAPYICWVHGEEIAYARSSRELTRLTTAIYAGAQAILANSHNSASMLTPFGVDQRRVTVIHPGVDATRFGPTPGPHGSETEVCALRRSPLADRWPASAAQGARSRD